MTTLKVLGAAAASSVSDPCVLCGWSILVPLSFQTDFSLTSSMSESCVGQNPTTSGLHDADIHIG